MTENDLQESLMRPADRLRSFSVASVGLILGLVFWLLARPYFPMSPETTVQNPKWVLLWQVILIGAVAYGLWRYLIAPLWGLVSQKGIAGSVRLSVRILKLSLPFGLICALLFTLLGFDLPMVLDIGVFLVLLFGWDWMKARSQPMLTAAVSST